MKHFKERLKFVSISGSTSRARKSPDASGAGTKPRLDDSAPAEQPLILTQDTPLQVDGRPEQQTEGVKVDALILQNPTNSLDSNATAENLSKEHVIAPPST
jgi:hypothetical protein